MDERVLDVNCLLRSHAADYGTPFIFIQMYEVNNNAFHHEVPLLVVYHFTRSLPAQMKLRIKESKK